MGRRIERERQQAIGFAGGILRHEHGVVGEALVVGQHAFDQRSTENHPVTAIVRRPDHVEFARFLQSLPRFMKALVVDEGIVNVIVEKTLRRDMRGAPC